MIISIKNVFIVITLHILSISFAYTQVTVFNNFGSDIDGWNYQYGFGWTIAGNNMQGQYGVEQAMGIKSTIDGIVTDVWVAICSSPLDATQDTVKIRLTRATFGLPPDSAGIMEEWTITNFGSWNQWNIPHHLKGKGTTHLQNGQWYWLWAVATENTWCAWNMNINPAVTCPHTLRREGEYWLNIFNETASAFRIDCTSDYNTSTPEIMIPHDYSLYQNYPNPFNSSTIITFSISTRSFVTIKIFNTLGKLVLTLVSEELLPGTYLRKWNANGFSSGIYYYQIHANDFSDTKILLLLK